MNFLALLLLANAACSDPYLSAHLAASENQSKLSPHGPPPRFTSCDECTEVSYSVAGLSGHVRIAPEPVLRIHRKEVADSAIIVEGEPYDFEKLYYILLLFPKDDLSTEIAEIVKKHESERFVIFSCSEVVQVSWVSPLWNRNIRAGVFLSEGGARSLAARLDLEPELIPFDPQADELRRIGFLHYVLGRYAGSRDARERIEREDRKLARFLEQYPRYWKIFQEEEEAFRRLRDRRVTGEE
jgi:hypothetical protein